MSKIIPAHDPWGYILNDAMNHTSVTFLNELTGDELLNLCKWLNEKRDMETSSRLIPLVDDLTHILIEAGKAKLH
jgi:hypothetical protein